MKRCYIYLVIMVFIFAVGIYLFVRGHVVIGHIVWDRFQLDTLALAIASDDASLKRAMAAYYFGGGGYDLDKARQYYLELYRDGNRDQMTLYQLGRIYFLENNMDRSIQLFDEQLELYPEAKRAHYTRGLTYIYRGDFEKAITDFETFVGWAPDEWAGYNDLSWAYFKNGEFEKSAEVALGALERFPDNLWLHNMTGVALWNTGELEEAEFHLERAQALVAVISVAEWGSAYPGNNPATHPETLEAMRVAVKSNLEGVRLELDAI